MQVKPVDKAQFDDLLAKMMQASPDSAKTIKTDEGKAGKIIPGPTSPKP